MWVLSGIVVAAEARKIPAEKKPIPPRKKHKNKIPLLVLIFPPLKRQDCFYYTKKEISGRFHLTPTLSLSKRGRSFLEPIKPDVFVLRDEGEFSRIERFVVAVGEFRLAVEDDEPVFVVSKVIYIFRSFQGRADRRPIVGIILRPVDIVERQFVGAEIVFADDVVERVQNIEIVAFVLAKVFRQLVPALGIIVRLESEHQRDIYRQRVYGGAQPHAREPHPEKDEGEIVITESVPEQEEKNKQD